MNPFRSLFLSLSRMPPALMLIIILGLAVVVTMLVMNKMQEGEEKSKRLEEQMLAEKNQKATVVFAARDIPEGALIEPEYLEEREIQQSTVPEGAVLSRSQAIGSYAAMNIAQGFPLLVGQLKHGTITTSGFEGRIKEGMRAVTFGVDTNTAVAGFIAPGSHVDILCAVGSGGETKVAPVMSDVEVIAVGGIFQKPQQGQSGPNPASSVTVQVSPEDSAKLVKADKAGQLYLTLRNDKDHTPVAVVDVSSLFPKTERPSAEIASLPPPSLPPPPLPGGPMGGFGGPPPPPPPPPMHEIELWSGGKKEVLSVPQG